jgi:hypothetical protein
MLKVYSLKRHSVSLRDKNVRTLHSYRENVRLFKSRICDLLVESQLDCTHGRIDLSVVVHIGLARTFFFYRNEIIRLFIRLLIWIGLLDRQF